MIKSELIDMTGKSVGSLELPENVFGVKSNKVVVYDVVRWHMAKKRQGTSSAKGISEVSGSTKKKSPQKETGKARFGDGREPNRRGGGICHGPNPRSYEFDLNKKVKKLALKMSVSAKVLQSKAIFVDSFKNYSSCKTSDFKSMIKSVVKNADSKSKILFVAEDFDESFKLGASAIYPVNLIKFAGLNTLSIMQHEFVVFENSAFESMKGWVQ